MVNMMILLSIAATGGILTSIGVHFLRKRFDGARVYECQCGNKGIFYVSRLRHKDPAAAAIDFAERTDILSNGYPFLNGKVDAIEVTDVKTGFVMKYGMEMKQKYTYHINIQKWRK